MRKTSLISFILVLAMLVSLVLTSCASVDGGNDSRNDSNDCRNHRGDDGGDDRSHD